MYLDEGSYKNTKNDYFRTFSQNWKNEIGFWCQCYKLFSPSVADGGAK